MKTFFQCEICREKSDDRATIEACEAKGHPDLSLCPPIGLLVGDNCGPGVNPSGVSGSPRCSGPEWNKGTPCNSHHCGAGFIWVVQATVVSPHDAHEHHVGFGNFRGNGCGDTFDFSGKAKGGYDTFKMGSSKYYPEQGFRRWQAWPEAQICPAFWRAVKALREAKIQPMVMRKGELVPFNDPHPHDHYEKFPIGAKVRLKDTVKHIKKGGAKVAEIIAHIYEDQGGLTLNEPLGGMQHWNVEDVEPA